MRNLTNLLRLAAAACLLLLPNIMHAQASFVIEDPIQSGLPGSTLTFHAAITNIGGADLYLNADSLNADPGLTPDDTPFFTNFPLFLTPGQTVTDALFQVNLAPILPTGDYFGSFTILGGTDGAAFDTLGTQNFQVTALADTNVVPEGNSLQWLVVAMLPLALLTHSRRRKLRIPPVG